MPNQSMSMSVRIRLSAMMFFQFAIHAVWIAQLGAYLMGGDRNFTGAQTAWVANAIPLGCLLAPIFVGMIADRFFASEKVLAVLNLLGAGLLFWASTISSPIPLFAVLLLQQLCYMPTWAITNSIAIGNCKDTEKDLPSIRMFGSVGWAATALFGIVALALLGEKVDGTRWPMVAGAVLSVIAGLFAFALPHTPPPAAGKKTSLADVLGLKALALMKKSSFAMFIIVSLVVMIPFAAYWTFFSKCLASLGVGLITGTMHLGVVVEVFVMWLLLPIALKRIGVKWTLVLGVAILGLRYLMFMFGNGEEMMFMNYGGILVHGFIFSFFFVTGYIYVDRIAPKEIRAQGQALIMLVTFGAGMLLGNWINGMILDANEIPGEPVAKTYKIPGDIAASPTLTIDGAKISDSVAYTRALNAMEMEVLNAEQQNRTDLVKRLKQEYGDKVKLDQGKITAGAEAKAFTFSTWLELPKDSKELSGEVYSIGTGANAVQLGLDKGRLSIQAGQTKMTHIIPLAIGEKVHVAGTFDGDTLKLYSGGRLYKRWHWRKVWTYPAIISAVLMLAMIVLFHPPAAKKEGEEPAPEPADEAPADEPPAEE